MAGLEHILDFNEHAPLMFDFSWLSITDVLRLFEALNFWRLTEKFGSIISLYENHLDIDEKQLHVNF